MTTALLLGADGFIGRHIAFELRDSGWQVLCCARDTRKLRRMGFDVLTADLTNPETHLPAFWRDHLAGVDFVINAAGLLTGSEAEFRAVHVAAPEAVYGALPDTARGVLISAVGLDADTAFARFRRAGEAIAGEAAIPVSSLRCGLVLADTSYGGSSVLRALAALPVRPLAVGDGQQQLNPIHAADLAAVIREVLTSSEPPEAMDIGGPESITQTGLLTLYRGWLGLPAARPLFLSPRIANTLGGIGDALKFGPISRTALAQLSTSVLADTTQQAAKLKTEVRGVGEFVPAHPAGSQDLWHARLYLMRPLLRLALAFLWLASGLVGLLAAPDTFLPMLHGFPLTDTQSVLAARLFGAADLLIALALLRAWRLRTLAWIQFAVVLGYTGLFGLLAPSLWAAPFGGLIKNIPVLALILVHRVLEEER